MLTISRRHQHHKAIKIMMTFFFHFSVILVYYTVEDKNITEMQTVGYAVSDAGIRAPLYWFHDAGYFEEFLGHKKGEELRIY